MSAGTWRSRIWWIVNCISQVHGLVNLVPGSCMATRRDQTATVMEPTHCYPPPFPAFTVNTHNPHSREYLGEISFKPVTHFANVNRPMRLQLPFEMQLAFVKWESTWFNLIKGKKTTNYFFKLGNPDSQFFFVCLWVGHWGFVQDLLSAPSI